MVTGWWCGGALPITYQDVQLASVQSVPLVAAFHLTHKVCQLWKVTAIAEVCNVLLELLHGGLQGLLVD